jgi:ubiquinone/menaquinone biosynthesis C-methylase UbiE
MTPLIDSSKLTRWYDFQAPLYRLWRNRFDSPLVEHVVSLAGGRTGPASILDAGCGTGLFAISMARRSPTSRVVGVDLSAGMLAVAISESRDQELTNTVFSRADVTELPFDRESFDVVVAAGLMPNVNDPRRVLRELSRVATPQGRLLIVEFDREAMGPALRLFFRTMILGYRSVSFVFRRFRFAESWDIDRSTIDRRQFSHCLADLGLHTMSVEILEGHLVFELGKGTPA